MAAIWVVSPESSLAAILAHHVGELGEICVGTPDRDAFKHAPAADLLILVAVTETGRGTDELERLLAFVRSLPTHRRIAPPVLLRPNNVPWGPRSTSTRSTSSMRMTGPVVRGMKTLST